MSLQYLGKHEPRKLSALFSVNDALLQVVGVADERLVHALLASSPTSGSRPCL